MIKPQLLQLGKFLSVGVMNTAISLLVIYTCKWLFNASDVAANAIGYGAGLLNSFVLNSRWTFGYRGPQLPAIAKFLLVALVAYAANLVTVLLSIRFGVDSYVAQAMGIPPYTLTSYLATKFLVFRAPGDGHEKST